MNLDLKPCPFCGVPYPYITFERGRGKCGGLIKMIDIDEYKEVLEALRSGFLDTIKE